MLRSIERVTKVAVVASFKVFTLTLSGRADKPTNILEKSAFRSSLEMGNRRQWRTQEFFSGGFNKFS